MLLDRDLPEGSVAADGGGQRVCPHCSALFAPRRKNQGYCDPACQKKATRNASRGSREVENAQRIKGHYRRAAWLANDVPRLPPAQRRAMILALLEAASDHDAGLRNILLDPALLGAAWASPKGKLYPDTRCPDALNIAKMVNAFCREEWGCGVRDAIFDNGKLARRAFAEATPVVAPMPEEPPLPTYEPQDPADFMARIAALRVAKGRGRTIRPPHIYEGYSDGASGVGFDGHDHDDDPTEPLL